MMVAAKVNCKRIALQESPSSLFRATLTNRLQGNLHRAILRRPYRVVSGNMHVPAKTIDEIRPSTTNWIAEYGLLDELVATAGELAFHPLNHSGLVASERWMSSPPGQPRC